MGLYRGYKGRMEKTMETTIYRVYKHYQSLAKTDETNERIQSWTLKHITAHRPWSRRGVEP